MAFPVDPTNGQTANINGVVYTYSSSLTAWQVTTTFSGNVTVDQINANTVVSVGSITGTDINGTDINGTDINGTTLTVTDNITSGNLVITGSVTGNLTVTGNVVSPFYVSASTITANTTLGAVNTMSPGPVTIADGVTVIVSSGGEWSIV